VDFDSYEIIEFNEDCLTVMNTWDFFRKMTLLFGKISILTADRKSKPIPKSQCARHENIFIEGAKLEFVTLNALSGPIYIGKDAEIMEGSVIRGPFALCEGAVVMAAKVYGATTVGPHSRIGGEVNNSVISAYSNKGHDGFRKLSAWGMV
jgi:NDP-sugar pyrophosphorylase family protein